MKGLPLGSVPAGGQGEEQGHPGERERRAAVETLGQSALTPWAAPGLDLLHSCRRLRWSGL